MAIAIIPARMESTRLPGKLMMKLGGKPIILQTYLATIRTKLFSEVIVATDNDLIENCIKDAGGHTFKSQKPHDCGSSRIAEAVYNRDDEIIINVQGDEPFTSKENLIQLLNIFKNDTHKKISVASLREQISDINQINNPNNVKVVCNNYDEALYFSRSPIPYLRNNETNIVFYKHIGLYAYRKEALLKFVNLTPSILEKTESLEQLRYLENGMRIKLADAITPTIGIDTIDDLKQAETLFDEFFNN